MSLQSRVQVVNNAPQTIERVRKARTAALREAGLAAARAWQGIMLDELREAARETAAGGSGRQWRRLSRRSARNREFPARQTGEFQRGWRRGAIDVRPNLAQGSARIRAEINHASGRALEIVASSATFFRDWDGPQEARNVLLKIFEAKLVEVMRRELSRP